MFLSGNILSSSTISVLVHVLLSPANIVLSLSSGFLQSAVHVKVRYLLKYVSKDFGLYSRYLVVAI